MSFHQNIPDTDSDGFWDENFAESDLIQPNLITVDDADAYPWDEPLYEHLTQAADDWEAQLDIELDYDSNTDVSIAQSWMGLRSKYSNIPQSLYYQLLKIVENIEGKHVLVYSPDFLGKLTLSLPNAVPYYDRPKLKALNCSIIHIGDTYYGKRDDTEAKLYFEAATSVLDYTKNFCMIKMFSDWKHVDTISRLLPTEIGKYLIFFNMIPDIRRIMKDLHFLNHKKLDGKIWAWSTGETEILQLVVDPSYYAFISFMTPKEIIRLYLAGIWKYYCIFRSRAACSTGRVTRGVNDGRYLFKKIVKFSRYFIKYFSLQYMSKMFIQESDSYFHVYEKMLMYYEFLYPKPLKIKNELFDICILVD